MKITVFDNGPLKVEGEFAICDSAGKTFNLGDKGTAYLCRCGHSEKKPFCDGAHKLKGFQSSVKAE